MTKILPTQDDYEADHIRELLENPDIDMGEKRALLEDPLVIEIADRLGSEVGINGEAPHVMEDWVHLLDDQEAGIGTKATPNAKNIVMEAPKETNRIALGIDQLFLENEADEVEPHKDEPKADGAKIVPMEQSKYLSKLRLGQTG